MILHERADKLLAFREDLYKMHFHQVDREWLIETMIDFAQQLPQQEISDEEIERWVASTPYYGHCTPEYREGLEEGAKWAIQKLKNK